MNTFILSTYGYVLVAMFESVWSTLLKLDRQARRDAFKVSCFVRTVYCFMTSPEMVYRYRRFAKMCGQITVILWLIMGLLAKTVAQIVEKAYASLQPPPALPSVVQLSVQAQPVVKPISAAMPETTAMPAAKPEKSRGFAKPCQRRSLTPSSSRRSSAASAQDVQTSNIRELKKLAATAKIPNYSRLTKAQLQAALDKL